MASSSDDVNVPPPSEAETRRAAELNIPQASFVTLVQLLATQSMAALGMIAGPDGATRSEPAVAKHFIDLLAVLEAKSQGNLDASEAKMLDSLLHDLRMAYVQASK